MPENVTQSRNHDYDAVCNGNSGPNDHATVKLSDWCDFWRIVKATGDVTIDFGNGKKITRQVNDFGKGNGRKDRFFKGDIKIWSTAAETVTITFGDEIEGKGLAAFTAVPPFQVNSDDPLEVKIVDPLGRQADAASVSVALSTDDMAVFAKADQGVRLAQVINGAGVGTWFPMDGIGINRKRCTHWSIQVFAETGAFTAYSVSVELTNDDTASPNSLATAIITTTQADAGALKFPATEISRPAWAVRLNCTTFTPVSGSPTLRVIITGM